MPRVVELPSHILTIYHKCPGTLCVGEATHLLSCGPRPYSFLSQTRTSLPEVRL
jgi:hypothetical protein